MKKNMTLNYKKLSYFLNQKFWFQLDILIQFYLFFSKNSSEIELMNGENIWNMNNNNFLKFYFLFYKVLFPNLLSKTSFLILIGVYKIDLKYIEDKIVFLEIFLMKFWKCNITKFLDLSFILLDLVKYKILTSNWKESLLLLNQIKFIKKINPNNNLIFQAINFWIKNLGKKFLNYNQTILTNHKKLFYLKKMFSKLIKIIFFKKKKIGSNVDNLYLRNILTYFYFNLKNNEKENWFESTYLFRFNGYRIHYKSFFKKFQLHDFIFNLSFKKKVYLTSIIYIFLEKTLKRRLRLSFIGRHTDLYPTEANLTLQKNFWKKDQKLIISYSRQIFYQVCETSLNKKKYLIERIQKRIIEIILYRNCLSYRNVIKNQLPKI